MLPSGILAIPIGRKSNLQAKDDKMVAQSGRKKMKTEVRFWAKRRKMWKGGTEVKM